MENGGQILIINHETRTTYKKLHIGCLKLKKKEIFEGKLKQGVAQPEISKTVAHNFSQNFYCT